MIERIKKQLFTIEKEYDIHILLACETGSRAWGFPSPDSDYDIRFIYKHKCDWYLSLEEGKDTFELMLDNNELDISGWDIRKTLRLLWKSNPPLLERIQSPVIYMVDPDFSQDMVSLAHLTYSRIATIHHYLNMAKNCLSEIDIKKPYKLKKFFYALRASMACQWILEKESMPPIYFPTMVEELKLGIGQKERIYSLILLKSEKEESYLHSGEQDLLDYMRKMVSYSEYKASQLPPGRGNRQELDTFFRKIVQTGI